MTYLIVMGGLGVVTSIGVMVFLSYVVPRDLREIETRKQLGYDSSPESAERDDIWGAGYDGENGPDDDILEDAEPDGEPAPSIWGDSIFSRSPEEHEDEDEDDPTT